MEKIIVTIGLSYDFLMSTRTAKIMKGICAKLPQLCEAEKSICILTSEDSSAIACGQYINLTLPHIKLDKFSYKGNSTKVLDSIMWDNFIERKFEEEKAEMLIIICKDSIVYWHDKMKVQYGNYQPMDIVKFNEVALS